MWEVAKKQDLPLFSQGLHRDSPAGARALCQPALSGCCSTLQRQLLELEEVMARPLLVLMVY